MIPRRILIVEGGWQRGALAATRSLGRAGHYVAIASEVPGHSARSRYSARWFRLPKIGSPSFLERIRGITRGGSFEVMFAGDDEHLLHLSEHRAELAPAVFPYPAHPQVLRALDKVALYEAARSAGLSVPETVLSPPEGDAEGWIAKERLYGPGSSHEHLHATELRDGTGRNLVFQRIVEGHLLALVTLVSPASELLYAGAQRADAVFPEPFGVSVRARSVDADGDLVNKAGELLRELGWSGIAELQFIVSGAGEPHLIDLNGRFFGSLGLSEAAGVDLPSAWVESAFGAPVRLPRAATGVRYQWLEGDLRRAAASRTRRAETIAALRFAPGAVHSLWSGSDPAPALRLVGDLARRAVGKVVSR